MYKLYYVEVKSSLCCKKRIQGYHIMHSTNIGVFRCEANDVCSIHRQWTGLKRPSFGCLIPAATGKKAPSTCNLHNTLVRRLLVLADLAGQWILARNEYIPGISQINGPHVGNTYGNMHMHGMRVSVRRAALPTRDLDCEGALFRQCEMPHTQPRYIHVHHRQARSSGHYCTSHVR